MFTVTIHYKSQMNDQLTGLAHPRARGKRALDETAFLQSQKDWNLKRDDGWTGVEVLFEIDKERFNNDTPNPMSKVPWLYEDGCIVLDLADRPLKAYESIPLTISSIVEGELMEAIIRYDNRIAVGDFWARLSVLIGLAPFWGILITRRPGICGNGPIFKSHTLTERRGRFRLADGVMSWGPPRLGGESIKSHLESKISPAMKAANQTKGLRKFTKAEQNEAKKPNAGKHQQKAAGWARSLRREEERARRRQNRRATPSHRKLRVLRPRAAPQPIDLDGYGPLVFGGANGPLRQHENQHIVPLVGVSPNLQVESPATSYNNFDTSSITYDQFAPYFVPPMSTYSPESTLGEQELNPYEDLIDWDGGESDEHMEWMT